MIAVAPLTLSDDIQTDESDPDASIDGATIFRIGVTGSVDTTELVIVAIALSGVGVDPFGVSNC